MVLFTCLSHVVSGIERHLDTNILQSIKFKVVGRTPMLQEFIKIVE